MTRNKMPYKSGLEGGQIPVAGIQWECCARGSAGGAEGLQVPHCSYPAPNSPASSLTLRVLSLSRGED